MYQFRLVIVPTISLQTDQCQGLKDHGISATCLSSVDRNKLVSSEILQNKYKVVFVTSIALFNEEGHPEPKPFFELISGDRA